MKDAPQKQKKGILNDYVSISECMHDDIPTSEHSDFVHSFCDFWFFSKNKDIIASFCKIQVSRKANPYFFLRSQNLDKEMRVIRKIIVSLIFFTHVTNQQTILLTNTQTPEILEQTLEHT